MEEELFINKEFVDIISNNCKSIIEYMIKYDIKFSIFLLIESIDATPKLPKDILPDNGDIVIFNINNFNTDSINFEDNFLKLDMAFGENAFISNIKIPMWSILQILNGNHIEKETIFFNPLATRYEIVKNKIIEIEGIEKSMKSFKL